MAFRSPLELASPAHTKDKNSGVSPSSFRLASSSSDTASPIHIESKTSIGSGSASSDTDSPIFASTSIRTSPNGALFTILGHRGEGCTNRYPSVFRQKLPPRTDSSPHRRGKILPENALSAFESALKNGADGVECDVFITADGIPVVIHDDQLARNVDNFHCFGKGQDHVLGNVSDYKCSELKAKFSIGNDEPIPTLDELIQLIIRCNPQYRLKNGRNITLNIELKCLNVLAVYLVVKQYIDSPLSPLKVEDFLFNSFDRNCLIALKRLDPRLRCALGFTTKELFPLATITMPGFVPAPLQVTYPEETKSMLGGICNDLKLDGVDLVVSDVIHDELGKVLENKGICLNAATNDIRLKLEEKQRVEGEIKSDLELEEREVIKLYNFSQKYRIQVYYKADNPAHMKKLIKPLAIKHFVNAEKERADMFIDRVKSKYPIGLFHSLREHLMEYAEDCTDDLGKALASSYCDVLRKF